VAWLLRSNRLYGGDGRLASARVFAAGFRGGSWLRPVSASQVSRWETGAVRAGFPVLRRYEELLQLAPNRLVAVADWVYRKASGGTGAPVLGRRLDPEDPRVHERAEQLLDQALSTQVMGGADWDELTGHLGALRSAFLYPASGWAELAERLLAELLITDGAAWLSRIEALARLIGHPRARPAIIAGCAALAADPNGQVVIEPLTFLDQTADRAANRFVLSQLRSPSTDRALFGALLSSVEKLARRHFRPDEVRLLTVTATDLLAHDDVEVRHLAAELLRRAPAGAVPDRLRGAVDPVTWMVLTSGHAAQPPAEDRLVSRIARAADPRAGADPVLAGLLRQLLFHPVQNDRLVAALLIAATPYREPVGAALAAELAAALPTRTVTPTTSMLASLPFLGRPADRGLVERIVLAPDLPAPLVQAAVWLIGHVPGRSPDPFWLAAVRRHRTAWQGTRDPASLSALRGIVYALGLDRHRLLPVLRADTRLPPQARAAATWWLNIPTYISTSAAT
jgi:hypothetical protein